MSSPICGWAHYRARLNLIQGVKNFHKVFGKGQKQINRLDTVKKIFCILIFEKKKKDKILLISTNLWRFIVKDIGWICLLIHYLTGSSFSLDVVTYSSALVNLWWTPQWRIMSPSALSTESLGMSVVEASFLSKSIFEGHLLPFVYWVCPRRCLLFQFTNRHPMEFFDPLNHIDLPGLQRLRAWPRKKENQLCCMFKFWLGVKTHRVFSTGNFRYGFNSHSVGSLPISFSSTTMVLSSAVL